MKKVLFLLSLSFFSLNFVAEAANGSSALIPYSKENKIYKEFHTRNSYIGEYEKGGSNYSKKYENPSSSTVPYSKEGVADGDVIPCFTGEDNTAARVGNGRKFHSMFGMVGDKEVDNKLADSQTPYDMTVINDFRQINENYMKEFRGNSSNQRYCNAKQLKNGGNGEYDIDRIYCEAGMETEVFLGGVEDPYTGKIPSCKLVLDTNIKIDEVRYLRQIISPDNTSGTSADNYSMGNGLVKCSVKNGGLYLEMLENPTITTSCDKNNYDIFDGGKGCCNPITGFGCNAQYCQYGADKHCKGENIPDVGSCKFESKIITFVKGIVTLDADNGGNATFKCQENGSWLTVSSNSC